MKQNEESGEIKMVVLHSPTVRTLNFKLYQMQAH